MRYLANICTVHLNMQTRLPNFCISSGLKLFILRQFQFILLILNDAKATLNGCGKLSSLIFVLTNETPFFSVKVFNVKVRIVDTIFASSTEEETATLRGHPNHSKDRPFEGQRQYLPFFGYQFKALQPELIFLILSRLR